MANTQVAIMQYIYIIIESIFPLLVFVSNRKQITLVKIIYQLLQTYTIILLCNQSIIYT